MQQKTRNAYKPQVKSTQRNVQPGPLPTSVAFSLENDFSGNRREGADRGLRLKT